jgi:hypothetical protein
MRIKKVANRLLVERPLLGDGRPREAEAAAPRSRRIRKVPRSVKVNLAESPLGWLLARGHITERQFAAGEQLRGDWERAQLAPRVTADLEAPPLSRAARAAPRSADPTEAQLAAKRRFEAAVAAVGSGLSDILWRVVCAGDSMRDAETALGWPARAGKLVLTFALDRLAGFYRLR